MVVIGAEAQGGVGDMEALFPCGSDYDLFFIRPPAMMFHVLLLIYLLLSEVCTACMPFVLSPATQNLSSNDAYNDAP